MYDLITKNSVWFWFSILPWVLGSYTDSIRALEDDGVDFKLMKKNKLRSAEIRSFRGKQKTVNFYLFNDSGLLVKFSTTTYDLKTKKNTRQYFYNYEFDDQMLLTKEVCTDIKDSILFTHNYAWNFLSQNILEVRQIGHRFYYGDGSPDTIIEVPLDNSSTIIFDSNNHIINCLTLNYETSGKDSINETYSYNDKGQIENVYLTNSHRMPNYFFKYNKNGKITEVIGGYLENLNDTLGENKIMERQVKSYDEQNRLIKSTRTTSRGREYLSIGTYFYEYDRRGNLVNSRSEGNQVDYKNEEYNYYGNGLLKKRVRKILWVDMAKKNPYHLETETYSIKYK